MRLKDWSSKESYRSNDAGWSKHTHIHTQEKIRVRKMSGKNGWVTNILHGNNNQHKKRMKNALLVQMIKLHTLSCECTATAHTLTHSVCVSRQPLCIHLNIYMCKAQPVHGWFVLHTRALTDGHRHTCHTRLHVRFGQWIFSDKTYMPHNTYSICQYKLAKRGYFESSHKNKEQIHELWIQGF